MKELPVLDANLRALLARAYVPVRPPVGLRARLGTRLAAELDQRAAAALARSRRRTALRAAAALLAVGLAALAAWRGLSPGRPGEAPFAGSPAPGSVRERGAWRALDAAELAAGIEHAGGEIEVVAPQDAALRVWLGAAGRAVVEPSGRARIASVDAAGPAAADGGRADAPRGEVADAPGGGHADLACELIAGALTLERYARGGSWTLGTAHGAFALDRGALRVALEPHSALARLDSGSARARLAGGELALEIGSELRVARGERVADASADEAPPARRTPAVSATEGGGPAPEPASRPRLAGRVLPLAGREPPASARVTLLREVRLPRVADPEHHDVALVDGRFALEDLEPGTYTVFVEAPAAAVWQRAGLALREGTTELEVELSGGSPLRGRVVDHAGAPVAGARVLSETDVPAQVVAFDPAGVDEGGPAFARSDEDGRFEFPALSHGRHVLRATAAGHGAGWSQPVALSPGVGDGAGEVELRLSRPGSIVGRALGPDGAPEAGAIVIAARIEYAAQRSRISFGHAVADAEGAFAVRDLPPGYYAVLRPRGDRGSPDRGLGVREARVEAGETVEVELGPSVRGTEVAGRVVGADGEGLAGFDVMLIPAGRDWTQARWQSDRSREGGAFTFDSVAPGAYEAYVGRSLGSNFVRAGIVVVPAAPRFEPVIELGPGSIAGRVRAAEGGRPEPRAWLVLMREEGSGWAFHGRVQADGGGAYRWEGLAPGRYRAVAYGAGGLAPASGEVLLSAAASAAELDLALERGASLALTVRDARGRPVEEASVRFEDASGERVEFSPEDVTDVAGALAVPGIAPGRWKISVEKSGHAPASATVDLARDQHAELAIELRSLEPR